MLTEVIMPQMGESIFEGTVTRWLKKVGDRVVRDEPLFEISTDKVDSEIPAPATGILKEIRAEEGATVQINTIVALIEASETGTEIAVSKTAPEPSTPVQVTSGDSRQKDHLRSSPLVRRIAREEKVDLELLQGTGLEGRIAKKDILEYLEKGQLRPMTSPASGTGATPEGVGLPPSQLPRVEMVPLSVMRKSIAERMLNSRRISAHVSTLFEVEMTRIARIRDQKKESFLSRTGAKLTYLPFILKACAAALKEFPVLNASIEDNNILYKKEINLGLAVALDWGLIVPVIKNAGVKSIADLAREAGDLAARARQKKLSPAEVQDGTFTITNPGIYGSLLGTPIIHQPQVAILCIGAITKRPVVIDDAIAIRSMVYLTLTFDHRLIDGAVADQFMASLKKKLEGWEENEL